MLALMALFLAIMDGLDGWVWRPFAFAFAFVYTPSCLHGPGPGIWIRLRHRALFFCRGLLLGMNI